jgi:hypothetical protein
VRFPTRACYSCNLHLQRALATRTYYAHLLRALATLTCAQLASRYKCRCAGGRTCFSGTCGWYMIEVWTACGMDLSNVEFVWASDFIDRYASKYWFNVLQVCVCVFMCVSGGGPGVLLPSSSDLVLFGAARLMFRRIFAAWGFGASGHGFFSGSRLHVQIATQNNLTRVKRCGQIMGRAESDSLTAAQIFYPCMQYVHTGKGTGKCTGKGTGKCTGKGMGKGTWRVRAHGVCVHI